MVDTATVIKAWRDPDFRGQLTPEQRATMPSHPAGIVEISEADMETVAGATTWWCWTIGGVTAAASCHISCDNTYFDGSCNAFTYGCCPAI